MNKYLIFLVILSWSSYVIGEQAAKVDQLTEEQSNAPVELDKFVISGEKQRELSLRLIRIGLGNPRSSSYANKDNVVCIIQKPTGSNLKNLTCATNETWENERAVSLSRVSSLFGISQGQSLGRGFASAFSKSGYISKPGKIFGIRGITKAKINGLVNEISGNQTDEENVQSLEQELRLHNLQRIDGRYGYGAEDYLKFVTTYRIIKTRLAENAEADGSVEKQLIQIVEDNDLSIDGYNTMMTYVEQDPLVFEAVSVALAVNIN